MQGEGATYNVIRHRRLLCFERIMLSIIQTLSIAANVGSDFQMTRELLQNKSILVYCSNCIAGYACFVLLTMSNTVYYGMTILRQLLTVIFVYKGL